MNRFLSRNAIKIVSFIVLFLSFEAAFGGNDTIPSSPQTAEEWYKRGFIMYIYNQSEEEIFCYKKAIELKPDYVEAYFKLGQVYIYPLKQYDEAIRWYKKIIELKPDCVRAYLKLGNVYAGLLEQKDKALEYYDKALELNPDYAFAFYRLGIAYANKYEQYEKAIKCFEKAIELEPDYGYAYYYMGDAYQALGKEKEAIEFYKEAARLKIFYAKEWLRDNNISWEENSEQ